MAAAIGVAVVLLGAFFLVGLLGLGGSGHEHDERPTTPSAPPSTVRPVAPASRVQGASPTLAVVALVGTPPDEFGGNPTIGDLRPGSVIRVDASGFEGFERGTIEQCVTELGRATACTAASPVQFGENGGAEFQYRLDNAFAPGRCRSDAPSCSVRLRGDSSRRQDSARTVFEDRAPAARVTVDPLTDVADGEEVRVSVTGFPAGVDATAMLCAPPSGYDATRCGSEGATARFRIGGDGSGSTELPVRAGLLGTEAIPCGPRGPCGVVVVTEDGFVAAPAVPVGFSRGPGAAYDPGRLAIGFAVAALLAALAVVVTRRTDWRKPSEASSPELDDADLQTDESLDDLFGTDEELEASDPARL